jgi:hypothetical protein
LQRAYESYHLNDAEVKARHFIKRYRELRRYVDQVRDNKIARGYKGPPYKP